MSHDDIVHKVWGRGYSGARQNLRRAIGSLRHKIEPDPAHPAHLISVRGSGYRLRVRSEVNAEPEAQASAAADTAALGDQSRSRNSGHSPPNRRTAAISRVTPSPGPCGTSRCPSA